MEKIQKILSDIGKHTLHLYTSKVNKYSIQAPFIAQTKPDEKIVYVTKQNPTLIINGLNDIINLDNINLSIINPSKICEVKNSPKLRIVNDSIDYNIVKKIKSASNVVLSTYELSGVEPKKIKQLAEIHDTLVLTNDDSPKSSVLVASETFDKIDNSAMDKFVKGKLKTIILALILNKPMCGTDITKMLHKKFNVLISPGTLYPLLHNLEKNGLLKCDCKLKSKIYKAHDEVKVRNILNQHVQVSRILSRFLEANVER